MRIFISAGEPSGDLHAANLVRALKELRPDLDFVGFGGDKLQAAGCRLLYPLCRLAVMWFARVLANATTFLSLISRADRFFRHQRPDAVVLIDFPGFNWWIARRAHFHGIPVFYFVPPQIWAWMPWRVKKMRRFVDHVLCSLPFEPKWYAERGVAARWVGHPFFDEVPQQRLDAGFLAQQNARGGTVVGLLPGSRTQELDRNLSTLVRAADIIRRDRPDTRFLVACFREHHQEKVEAYLRRHPGLPIEAHVGRTPEIMELSRACIAVSGSVSLELLHREKPAVVLYRIGRLDLAVARPFIRVPYISLVNLLAGKALYPEFLTDRNEAPAIARHVLGWLNDGASYRAIREELAALRQQVGMPGACATAARCIVEVLQSSREHRRAS